MTGLSVAFDTLVQGLSERSISHCVIDASAGTSTTGSGSLSLRRALGALWVLVLFVRKVRHAQIVYLPIGRSKLGFLRDASIVWLASLSRRKIVLHLHGGGYKEYYLQLGPTWKTLVRNTLQRASTVIVLAEALREQFDFLSCRTGPEIVVVPNGLPYETCVRDCPKALHLGEVRILYLSNMIPSKGYPLVLDACRHLKRRGRIRFRCEFAGEFLSVGTGADAINPDEARTAFAKNIGDSGISEFVRYRGQVRDREKQELLSQADVLLLPTYYPGEGQPISIIEAMSAGIPVVTTRYRGIPEMIHDGENGILLDEPTGEAIAIAVEQVVSDPERYQWMSARALATFRAKFTREQHLDKLVSAILG